MEKSSHDGAAGQMASAFGSAPSMSAAISWASSLVISPHCTTHGVLASMALWQGRVPPLMRRLPGACHPAFGSWWLAAARTCRRCHSSRPGRLLPPLVVGVPLSPFFGGRSVTWSSWSFFGVLASSLACLGLGVGGWQEDRLMKGRDVHHSDVTSPKVQAHG